MTDKPRASDLAWKLREQWQIGQTLNRNWTRAEKLEFLSELEQLDSEISRLNALLCDKQKAGISTYVVTLAATFNCSYHVPAFSKQDARETVLDCLYSGEGPNTWQLESALNPADWEVLNLVDIMPPVGPKRTWRATSRAKAAQRTSVEGFEDLLDQTEGQR